MNLSKLPTRAWTRRSPAVNLTVVCPERITPHHFRGSHQTLEVKIIKRNIAESLILILFWFATGFIITGFVLPFTANTSSPDGGLGIAMLFVGPMVMALFFGIGMALISLIRFRHIRKKYRIIGFSIITFIALGFIFLETMCA